VHRCGPTPRYVCPSAAWQESQGIDLSSPEYAAKALAAMEAEKERFRAQEAGTDRDHMRWDEEDDSPPDAARIEAATKLLEAGAAAAAYTAARRLAAEESDLCRCDPQYNPCSKCAPPPREKVRVCFSVIDTKSLILKVLGVFDHHTTYDEPPSSLGLKKDDEVRLVSGKYPLDDYKDLAANHVYTFQLKEGTISGILSGFTCNCTPASTMDLGTPCVSVMI